MALAVAIVRAGAAELISLEFFARAHTGAGGSAELLGARRQTSAGRGLARGTAALDRIDLHGQVEAINEANVIVVDTSKALEEELGE